jgi:HNH endonuclease
MEDTIPKGKKVCECGCNEEIELISKNRGELKRFKHGHNRKWQKGLIVGKGNLNPNWRGGAFITVRGYRMVYKPNHPRAGTNGYVFEHIVVLEQKLGRPLLPNEDTHHLNGIKTDNRPENLTNLVHSEHSILSNRNWRQQHQSSLGASIERIDKYLN